MEEEHGEKDKDAFIATMYRLDPDRLKQMRRIASGTTRCPECDAKNPAGERHCLKCGARLYPVEEKDDRWPWESHEDSEEEGSRDKG